MSNIAMGSDGSGWAAAERERLGFEFLQCQPADDMRIPSSHGTGQRTPFSCSSGFAGSNSFGSYFPKSSPHSSTKEAHSSRAKNQENTMNSGYQENAMTSEEREEYRALQARLKGLNDKILQAEHLRANAEYESNRYRREAFGVLARMATLEKLANRRAAAKL